MISEKRLFLVRHGETYSNRHGAEAHLHTPAGVSPFALTERGRWQAEALAAVLGRERFVAVFCSSAQRCRETLEPFLAAGHFPSTSVAVHDGLLEIDNDIVALIHHLSGRVPDPSYRPTHGFGGTRVPPETAEEYAARVRSVLDIVLAAPEGDVLVLAHHGTNNTLMAQLLGGAPWEFRHQENTCVNVVRIGIDRRAHLERVNCVAHLPPSLCAVSS